MSEGFIVDVEQILTSVNLFLKHVESQFVSFYLTLLSVQ